MNRKREAGSSAKDEIAAVREARRAANDGAVEISLRHAREHHLRWVVIGLVLGGLCVTQLGSLGQGAGVILLALAAWAGFRVVQTLRHPPGTFVIDGEHCRVPRGLCRGEPLTLTRPAINAAYLLRRAVAWHQAAPVLVIEAEGKVWAYPRDWFASEADQRRLLDALATEPVAAAAASPPPDAATAG